MYIHLISGPRNISTALMYSFAQRKDMKVIDEPFYACYLNKTGLDHPGREAVLKSQSHDPVVVIREVQYEGDRGSNVFIKNMSKHLVGIDLAFCRSMKNVFLIRDPASIIASFSKVVQQIDETEIGLKLSWELYETLNTPNNPAIVLNSDEVLINPELTLRKLCGELGIDFDSKMLSWPQGPIPEDGVWAEYWYTAVHQSTGFKQANHHKAPEVPSHFRPLLEEVLPFYSKLNAQRLTID